MSLIRLGFKSLSFLNLSSGVEKYSFALDLLTKIVKSAFEDDCEMPASKEISNFKLMHHKPKLLISFVDSKMEVGKNFDYVIKTKPLHILEQSINDKKILWSKIKEFKNESSTGKL